MIEIRLKTDEVAITGEDIRILRNVCLVARKFIEDTPTEDVLKTLDGSVGDIVEIRTLTNSLMEQLEG